ncbi:MAG: metallopeptidase TldD-related protein [Elusimicrobiota bacterium]|jgi:predicted Zn-dependent protease
MISAQRDRKLCDKIFSFARKKDAEVIVFSSESALTRFADNIVSQNVSNRSLEIVIRLVEGGRVGRVSLNHSGDAELKAAVESAIAMLKTQKPDPELLPLPKPLPVRENTALYDEKTAAFSPMARADRIAEAVEAAARDGQLASGTFDNGWSRVTVANSRGVFGSHLESSAAFKLTVKDGDGMGWADDSGAVVGEIDFSGVSACARAKARLAKAPRDVKPGRYTVVLEADPVANLLLFTSIYGFGGQFYQEGQSFMAGKLGRRVMGPNITLEDNGLDGPSASMPFDFEGMPRKKVVFVENGVAKAVAHDRRTAAKAKAEPTGHALPNPNPYGPIPTSVCLRAGGSSLEDMVKGTKRGLLVTQFHYLNVLKPIELELTGMTRNGTYMIEDGRLAYPVKNLRFTESLVAAFNRVEALSPTRKVKSAFFGGKFLVPAAKITDFCFSSATSF